MQILYTVLILQEYYEGVPFLVEEGSGTGVCEATGGSGGEGVMGSGEQAGGGGSEAGSPVTPTDHPITGPGFAEVVSSNFIFSLLLNLSLCKLY